MKYKTSYRERYRTRLVHSAEGARTSTSRGFATNPLSRADLFLRLTLSLPRGNAYFLWGSLWVCGLMIHVKFLISKFSAAPR